MQEAKNRIEVAANLMIIVVALLLCGVLVNRYVLSDSIVARSDQKGVMPGDRISFDGIDWRESDRTLILALSTDCRYCTESIPFYQKLSEKRTQGSGVRLITLMPQEVEGAKKYLTEHKVQVDGMAHISQSNTFPKGTPTLILVGKDGAVIESWAGKLTTDRENKVLTAVFGG